MPRSSVPQRSRPSRSPPLRCTRASRIRTWPRPSATSSRSRAATVQSDPSQEAVIEATVAQASGSSLDDCISQRTPSSATPPSARSSPADSCISGRFCPGAKRAPTSRVAAASPCVRLPSAAHPSLSSMRTRPCQPGCAAPVAGPVNWAKVTFPDRVVFLSAVGRSPSKLQVASSSRTVRPSSRSVGVAPPRGSAFAAFAATAPRGRSGAGAGACVTLTSTPDSTTSRRSTRPRISPAGSSRTWARFTFAVTS